MKAPVAIMTAKAVLTQALAVIVMASLAVLVLDVLWGVLSRFLGELVVWLTSEQGWEVPGWLPRGQSEWTEELARYLLMWVGLLGASVAFGAKSHLGVDYFVGKLEPSAQRAMFVVVQLAVLGFAGFAMVYGGWLLVSQTLAKGVILPALQVEKGYVYLAVPVSGVFIVLYALENIAEVVLGWGRPEEQEVEAQVEAEVLG